MGGAVPTEPGGPAVGPSPQTLSLEARRVLAAWAADCAEHVLAIYETAVPGDTRVRASIEQARSFAAGAIGVGEAVRRRGGDAGAAARDAPTPAATAAAYAAEQAAAVAHMGAHALGAAGYAAKASTLDAGRRDDEVARSEAHRHVAQMTDDVAHALASLPALGENRSGPLGAGRLSLGHVGVTIREIQRLLSERTPVGGIVVSVEELVVERDGALLAGSIWTPGSRPLSVVIMHPGSGASDRHNDVHFPPIRTALLEAGHAVASFDKRGVGKSTGSLFTTSIEQQAGDLLACADAVRDRFGPLPLGCFGHSQGGWVVYEAAATSDLIHFVIANSGPGVSVAEQTRHALAVETDGSADQAGALAILDALVERARRKQPLAQVLAEVDSDEAGSFKGVVDELLADEGAWGLTTLLLSYDPTASLAAIRVPLLAVFGADDPLVPIDASTDALRCHVDADLLQIRVFDHAGHRLEPSGGAGFVDGYLDTLIDFANVCTEGPVR